MARIVLENVSRRFGTDVAAVNDVSLEIEDGEFMVLVGPSGCGKTTLLRIVAGLENVTTGEVYIDGQQATDLPPKQRDIAMVFQNYALYPHLTVERNVGFGLKLRGMPKQEIRRRVREAARILGLEDMLGRKPAELSGGQRQRVAMGRAMVREPRAFLMDEPLSNLDAKLRVQMRAELGRLRERLRTTTIYVTHDQVEAMTLGDRVAVLRDGVIQQVDTPSCLYRYPSNIFVAAFIGSPSMNLVQAEIRDGRALFGGYSVPIIAEASALLEGRAVILGIRPSDFRDADLAHAEGPTVIESTAEVVEDLGSETHVIFSIAAPPVMNEAATAARSLAEDGTAILPLLEEAASSFTACIDSGTQARPGSPVRLAVNPARFHFFDPDTGLSLAVPDRMAAAT